MADAPALPAQTPGLFVGGGGSQEGLSGECAEAVSDCGLSEADFGSFEQVTAVVEAAQERCGEYEDTRWLEERERSFEFRDAEETSEEQERERLRRTPTSRELHLFQCVAEPLIPSDFFQASPGNASTNQPADAARGLPGAVGYDQRRAPAAPHPCGLTARTGANHVVSTLVPMLIDTGGPRSPGSAVTQDEITQLRARAIREVLGGARSEDEPNLRSTDLMASTRPRQTESERRDIEQVLPEPPQLAEADSYSADGADNAEEEAGESNASSPSQRTAEGCVGGAAEARQRAMQEDVRDAYTEGFVEEQQEAQREEREAERHHDQCDQSHDDAFTAAAIPPMDRGEEDQGNLNLQNAVSGLLQAAARRTIARVAAASVPALRVQALELAAGPPPSGEMSGCVPSGRTDNSPESLATMIPDG